MSDSSNSSSGGIGVGTLVFIALIILKATETIGMSWFWVISSIIWAPLGAAVLFFGIAALVAVIIAALDR